MAAENIPFVPNTLDPLKFIGRLPAFSGDKGDLYTFISLVDRINPLFLHYDELSQLLLIDMIKSKFTGRAKEAIEINFHAQSWLEIRTVLINYFGENQSVEQLYDKLRSVVFRTNAIDFYNEIKKRLRSLNNKTVSDLGVNVNSEQIARNNMRTALNVFKEKIPEPMRTILACRNPETLEGAMDIIFTSGYANYEGNDRKLNNRSIYRPRVGDNNGQRDQCFNSNTNGNRFSSISGNGNNRQNFNTRTNGNARGNVNFSNNNHNNFNSYHKSGQNYYRNHPNFIQNSLPRQSMAEPMDINMICNSNIPTVLENISPQQNVSRPQYSSNFFTYQRLSDNKIDQDLGSLGHSQRIEHEFHNSDQLHKVAGNTVTQNFPFLASPENYRI